jgi:DNA-binding transcriptional ArsR family regulator
MDTFSALADPTRRDIFELIAQKGKVSAGQIGAKFSVSSPAISQHLKVLKEAELVRVERRAQQRLYRVNPDALVEFEQWAKRTRQLWSQRFDKLDEVLKI